jgi:hypothetical protein
MHYMLLLYVDGRPAPDSPNARDYFSAMMDFHHDCRERGVLVASDPLVGPSHASTVRVRGGRVLRTDGPFAETTEWLGGYFIVSCSSFEEAVALAERCPTALVGSVEVRPVMEVAGAAAGNQN